MKKTGPATQNLTEALQEKTKAQRAQLAAKMNEDMHRLAKDLRRSSRDALNGFESDFQQQLLRIQNDINAKTQRIEIEMRQISDNPKRLILTSTMIGAITAALMMVAPEIWMIWRLQSVTVAQTETGTFLILPKSAEQGWTCGTRPCVKLED